MPRRLIIPFILLVLLGTFALQNIQILKVSFLFWSFNISQALLIIVCGCIGILLGFLIRLSSKRKHKVNKDHG
jgi:uncharacterized integral membrane protein